MPVGLRNCRCRLWAAALLLPLFAACSGEEAPPETVLIVKTAPVDGATVLVQGQEYGPTPVTIKGLVPGDFPIMVQRKDYDRSIERIKLADGDRKTVTIELDPLVGYLTIQSDPRGANFILDGEKDLGNTPVKEHPIPIGKHTYRLTKKNHHPVDAEIEIEESYRYTRKHKLTPLDAELAILSRPSGAKIWIDNEIQNETTPARFNLKPGTYLISVYTEGFIQKDEKVTIEPADKEQVLLEMSKGEAPPGMVLVPAGEFTMGANERAPDEAPKRKVHVDAFYIDKYEVTNEQFKKVFPEHTFTEGHERMPARGVSWDQAVQYAKAVGKRLPTEKEWEKAARGEDGREYPWGDAFDPALCNTVESKRKTVVPVDEFLDGASPYGCVNMAGNVYEWTYDWYQAYPGNNLVTKDYGQVFRVLRGGSFLTEKFEARCARRHFDRMDAQNPDYGFRCAKDVEN